MTGKKVLFRKIPPCCVTVVLTRNKVLTMKKMLFALIFPLWVPGAYCADSADIISGPEMDTCWRNHADRGKAAECLHELSNKSNQFIEALITQTEKQIKENNTGPVYKSTDPTLTIGDVFSKHFMDAQHSWIAYRENFCLGVGSQIGEESYDYWPSIYQCKINLNKRHAEEIKMLHSDQQ